MQFRIRKVDPYNFHITCPMHHGEGQSRGGAKVDVIVLHHIAGTLAGARSVFTHDRPPGTNVDIHYAVTKKGGIWQFKDEKYMAWHAGPSLWKGRPFVNTWSIGIELENWGDGKDPYPKVQIAALCWLVRRIAKRYDLPLDGQHITDHKAICQPPGRKVDLAKNFPWSTFWHELKHPTPAQPVPAVPPPLPPRPSEIKATVVPIAWYRRLWRILRLTKT